MIVPLDSESYSRMEQTKVGNGDAKIIIQERECDLKTCGIVMGF